MASDNDTLRKLETLESLESVPVGSEVVLVHRNGRPGNSFTVHGNFEGVDTRVGAYVDVTNHLDLPIELNFDPAYPGKLLTFLRGFQDPRFERKSESTGYNHFANPGPRYEAYQVVEK